MQMDLSEKAHCHVCEGMMKHKPIYNERQFTWEQKICECDKIVSHASYSPSPDLVSSQRKLADRAIKKLECLIETGWVQVNE